MKSSVFFRLCVLTIGLLGLLVGPNLSHATTVTLKLAHVAPPNTTYDNAALKLAERVAYHTGGKVKIKVYGSAQFGGVRQQFAQVKAGAIDMVLSDYFAGAIVEPKPKNFFVTLTPYLFDSMAHFHRFLKSDIFRRMMERVESGGNMKFTGFLGNRSPRMLTTSNRKVITPEDCKGLKLRVPPVPIYVEMWKQWGATPTPVPAKDIYTALKSGLVDGQDQTILAIWDAKYYEVQKYAMTLDHVLNGMGAWLNRDRWNSFSEETRAAILKSSEETANFMNEEVNRLTPQAEKGLQEKGIIMVKPDIEAFRVIGQKWPKALEGKVWEQGLYDKIRALK